MRIFVFISLLILFVSLSGCLRLLGIKNSEKVDERDQRKIENKLSIEFQKSALDTSVFNSMTNKVNEKSNEKLFYQPLQFYIYNKEELLSFGANCLYPGIPLNWNYYHQFDSLNLFIPYSLDTSKIYEEEIYPKIHKQLIENSTNDTIIIIQYTSFLFRHAKKYMNYVNQLDSKIKNKTVYVIAMDEVFRDESNW